MIVLVETVSIFFVLVLVDFDADATDKKNKERAQWVVKDIKGKHTNNWRRLDLLKFCLNYNCLSS